MDPPRSAPLSELKRCQAAIRYIRTPPSLIHTVVVNRKVKFAAHRSKEKERLKQREGGSSYCRKYYIQSKYYFISSLLKETQHDQDGTKSNACSSTSKLKRMKGEATICV